MGCHRAFGSVNQHKTWFRGANPYVETVFANSPSRRIVQTRVQTQRAQDICTSLQRAHWARKAPTATCHAAPRKIKIQNCAFIVIAVQTYQKTHTHTTRYERMKAIMRRTTRRRLPCTSPTLQLISRRLRQQPEKTRAGWGIKAATKTATAATMGATVGATKGATMGATKGAITRIAVK